jgi:hypothetical protein
VLNCDDDDDDELGVEPPDTKLELLYGDITVGIDDK